MDLKKYEAFFKQYVKGFSAKDKVVQESINLKVKHTYKTKEIARQIAVELGLSEEEIKLAECVALFHDIGRFSQLKEYGHFDDRSSIDHAEKSIQVLEEEKVLSDLSPRTKEVITTAIYHHNKKEMPTNITDPEVMLQIKLIRDADKTDIYRVFAEDTKNASPEKLRVLHGDSRLDQDISDSIYERIKQKKIFGWDEIKTMAEHEIAILSWLITDINFKQTIQIVLRQGYVEEYYEQIQKTERFAELYQWIMEEIRK